MVMKIGEIYPSNNYGDMEVIEYVNRRKVKVRFMTTEHSRYADSSNIRKGLVKDLYAPSVYGVGYLGEGVYGGGHQGYAVWKAMLQCYNVAFGLETSPHILGVL